MRRILFASLLVALAAAVSFAAYWFFVRGGGSNESAEAELTRLSKQSAETTYYARYESQGQSDPTITSTIVVYNKPSVGYRFDLPAPVDAKDDASENDDVLKSGDILIANQRLAEHFISCRTVRRSCRTADGLEGVAMASLRITFRYDTPIFEKPNAVTRGNDISTAGETGRCFVVSERAGNENEQARVEDSSFMPGELPRTFCYTSDGIPLSVSVPENPPKANSLKATEIRREVDD